MSDFPLSTFGKVSKKDLVATVSAKMRGHEAEPCASSTCTAIRTPSSGSPASSPMSRRWPSTGTGRGRGKQEDEVVAGFRRRRRRGGARRARSRDDRRTRRRASTTTSTAMQQRHPDRIIQSWARGRSVQGRDGDSRGASTRSTDLGMLGFHFHPIMGHFAVNDRALYPLFETIDALEGAGDDRCRHDRHGRRHAGRDGREVAPRASRRRSTSWPPIFPNLTIVAAHPGWPVGRRDDRGRAAQGQRFLGALGLGAEIFPAAAQGRHPRRGSRTR